MNSYRCQQCGHVLKTDKSPTADRLDCEKCSTPLSDNDMVLESGTVIGGFTIEKIIGQGGMGCVYKAKQASMGRDVALKVLHVSCTQDRKAVLQFINEIRATGQVRHRNIVTALEAGEDGGHYFMAMNYIDGDNLEERLQGGERLEAREALKIAVKIAYALDHVWNKLKMAHRDIKPSNIVLDRSTEPYLLDLGIAQFNWEEKASKGMVVGTPYYMSPEQAKAAKLDWRSDLYSLGATLYHLIVGAPPYDGDSSSKIIESHVLMAFPDPKSRNPDVDISPACVALLKTMMAKDPDERFASWGDFIEAAERIINNRKGSAPAAPSQAEPSPTAATPPRKLRQTVKITGDRPYKPRKNFPVLSYILLILLLLAGTGVYYFFARQSEAELSLEAAEAYLKANPQDFPKALELFSKAKDIAQNTKFKQTAAERYAAIKDAAAKAQDRLDRLNEGKRVVAEARELIDKKDYAGAVELLGHYADRVVAKTKQMIEGEDYAGAAQQLGDISEVEAPELAKDVATLLAVAKAKLEADAEERQRQLAAAKAKQEKLEAAERDKEKDLQNKLEQERLFLRSQLSTAFAMALNGKAQAAFDKLQALRPSEGLKDELGAAKAVKIIAVADSKIEASFSASVGKTLAIKLKDASAPEPMEVRAFKGDSLLVIPKGKVMGIKVKLVDLDTEDLILKTGAENPVTQAVIATFFYLRAGRAPEAADEARSAGPYADALSRFIEGKDRIKDDQKAEKRFLSILKKYFSLSFENAPTPAEMLKAVKGRKPACDEPRKARESFKTFLAKHQDSSFVKAYGESVQLVKAKLWGDLPLAPPDLFNAAKVDYDPKTRALSLDYDFSKDKSQLADWPEASFKDGRLYCGSGSPAYCKGVFDKVKITVSMSLLDQDAGIIASSAKTGSQVFFKAFGPETSGTPQLLLLENGKPPLVIAKSKPPKPSAVGSAALSVQDDLVHATDGETKFDKPMRNFKHLTVGVFSAGGAFTCDRIAISGVLNQEWLAAESKKLQQTSD